MLVRDVMTRDAVTARTTTTVKGAATALADHRISALPVVDGRGTVIGVVSEADLLGDAFVPDRRARLTPPDTSPAPLAMTVGEVMSSPAVTVHASTDVVEVVRTMRTHGYKSLPVVEDGLLVGVVSRSDLVRSRARSDDDIRREVVALAADLAHPEWGVVVVDGVVELGGVLTARDRDLAEASVATVAGVVRVTTLAS